jgi:hypothetical protein
LAVGQAPRICELMSDNVINGERIRGTLTMIPFKCSLTCGAPSRRNSSNALLAESENSRPFFWNNPNAKGNKHSCANSWLF